MIRSRSVTATWDDAATADNSDGSTGPLIMHASSSGSTNGNSSYTSGLYAHAYKCPDKCPTNRSTGIGKLFYCLVSVVVFAIVTYMFIIIYDMNSDPLLNVRSFPDTANKVTVVMNTFKRNDMMVDALNHYHTCNVVGHIHVIWSEKKPPPHKIVTQYTRMGKVVFDVHSDKDSLNSRFIPLKNHTHTDAIFSVDDDMRVPCSDLNLAYEVWRGSQRTIVGFQPRTVVHQGEHLVYRCWWTVWWRGLYHIILTKSAIIHHDYMHIYTNKMPQAVRDYVDARRNCEDLAMAFLVAKESSLPPIYVRGHLRDAGVLNGISTKGISTKRNPGKAKHMNDRSRCLEDLAYLFGGNPLRTSHIVINSAKDPFANQPSTWAEYISSDLWNF